ncbi:MAG: hypothetical protein K5871_05680 [Lachnospiraceae bacterium]|nr:hypothetical protein [Lachnospiraceae bacterium]
MLGKLVKDYQKNKRFLDYINEYGGDSSEEELYEDGSPKKEIRVFTSDGAMILPYRLNNPYYINNWKVTFAIFIDGNGDRYLLLDRNDKEDFEVIDLSMDRVELGEITCKGKSSNLTIEVVRVSSV